MKINALGYLGFESPAADAWKAFGLGKRRETGKE